MFQIILACIGSSALFSFITFLIQRNDSQKANLQKVEETLKELKKDNLRTQLLLLMSDYPSNRQEIMKVAEEYFRIGGNWYMTSMFKKFLTDKHIGKPEWFVSDK